MKDFFLCDCPQNENKVIVSSFVVASKQVKPRKTGELYLALILADRSGQIEAKMWDNVTDAMNTFEEDDVLKVKGLINKYKNRFQLTIHKLRRLEDTDRHGIVQGEDGGWRVRQGKQPGRCLLTAIDGKVCFLH